LNNKVFFEIPCLCEESSKIDGLSLAKIWFPHIDKRRISEALLRFKSYNQTNFDYLGVTPIISGFDKKVQLSFRSTKYVGVIPLRSPDTGKQIGDFIVAPKYVGSNRFIDLAKIFNLIDKQLTIEQKTSLPLLSGNIFHPPFYLEAMKFVNLLQEFTKSHWNKFVNDETNQRQPIGQVNWNKYTSYEFMVEKRQTFPVRKNQLKENHLEYCSIKYVFNLCKDELSSSDTPFDIKWSFKDKLNQIENQLSDIQPFAAKYIPIHNSDSNKVQTLKAQANKILKHNSSQGIAWRVDFANVFEKYVQYIFSKVAIENGGRLLSNFKIISHQQSHFAWSLKYLEPDAIFQKNELEIMIDAKYKSHFYNKWNQSDILKQDFRNDLHQILSYSSFTSSKQKFSFLCYPSQSTEISFVDYINCLNETNNKVALLGIPLNTDELQNTQVLISKVLSLIENRTPITHSISLQLNDL
jgi:hypothetical protein